MARGRHAGSVLLLFAVVCAGCFEEELDRFAEDAEAPEPFDAGDNGGEDDAGTMPVDQCVGDRDTEALRQTCYGPEPEGGVAMCTEISDDECRDVTDVVSDCATGACLDKLLRTIGGGAEDVAATEECIVACVDEQTESSPTMACTGCLSGVAICSARNCLSECQADSSARECVSCQCENDCLRFVTDCAGRNDPFCPITDCSSDADCEPDPRGDECSSDADCPDRHVCNDEGRCAERICSPDTGYCTTRSPCLL
ncbi:MAG: hypothetical protein ACOCUS_04605 [Polyangiales bacterium]